MKKNILKTTAFLLASVLTFLAVTKIFDFKYLDSTYKFDAFYELEDNTVDVLVLGSSHAYQGINTAVLWDEYGYAAFNLCGAAQPIWNTYYYLEEALKTQTPKVIILDAYYTHMTSDFTDESTAIKNTYGMKWSDTKKAAIEASFDTQEGDYQYFIEFLQYHTRYSDLKKDDFSEYLGNKALYENHKGFYCYFKTTAVTPPQVDTVSYYNYMTEKINSYFRKTIELAQSKDIPIIVTAIPFAAEAYHQGYFNTVKYILENEYNVPFYNFITDYSEAIGLDYSTDFADKQHLNYQGNTKLTRFLGDVLKEGYDVPDRRNDEKYSSWEKDAEVYFNQLENHNITKVNIAAKYKDVITNERYTKIITLSSNNLSETVPVNQLMTNTLLGNIISEQELSSSIWIIEGNEIAFTKLRNDMDFTENFNLGSSDGAYIKARAHYYEDGTYTVINDIYYNKTKKTLTTNGVNILVYDNFTQSLVDMVCIDFNEMTFHR